MSRRIAEGLEGPDRIFFCGHPERFTEAKIRELLEYFGPLRLFNISKDKTTGVTKGYGYCAYQDPSVTDTAIAALHRYQIGDKKIALKRATEYRIQPKVEQELQTALERLMLQPGDRNEEELQAALQGLMIQPSGSNDRE